MANAVENVSGHEMLRSLPGTLYNKDITLGNFRAT